VSNVSRITNSPYARRRRLAAALAKLEQKAEAYRARIAETEAELGTLVLFVPPLETRRAPIPITRDVLACLRDNGPVRSIRDIARWVIAKRAVPADPNLRGAVQQSVGACLRKLQRRGIVAGGDGRGPAHSAGWPAMPPSPN
jgi:hypothetical protein